MRILIFPFGSSGDVNPLVGLALQLRSRGHAVTMIANGYFRDLVQRAGLEYEELTTREEFLEQAGHPDLWHPIRAFGHLFRNGVARIMRRQYEMIADWAARQPVMVVNSCFGFGARIAREKLGVPLVTVHLQPACFWSDYETPTLPGMVVRPPTPRWLKRVQYWLGTKFFIDRVALPETNRFRGQLGLDPIREIAQWWHSPDCVLGLFPSWYGPAQPDWPQNVSLTQFPLWDDDGATQPREDVDQFLDEGDAPVLFTPGSGNMQAEAFFQEAAAACRIIGRRGLFLTRFSEQIPRNLPPSIRHFDYVPFSQVLPRAAALVHHGGIGSASQALRAGTPQLIMPLAHDQPDNAARIRRLGVGTSVPPSRFRASRVAASLQKLLVSPEVKRACRQVAKKFENVAPFDEACDVIQRFARRRGLIGPDSSRSDAVA